VCFVSNAANHWKINIIVYYIRKLVTLDMRLNIIFYTGRNLPFPVNQYTEHEMIVICLALKWEKSSVHCKWPQCQWLTDVLFAHAVKIINAVVEIVIYIESKSVIHTRVQLFLHLRTLDGPWQVNSINTRTVLSRPRNFKCNVYILLHAKISHIAPMIWLSRVLNHWLWNSI
jgi:hypothetical protein